MNSLILFSPELGLGALILLLLSFELFTKKFRARLISIAIGASFLLFIPLIVLWPSSAEALYGAFSINPLALFLKGILLAAGILTLFIAREYTETLGNRSNDFILLI
ncbi:MAG: hypothetical protein HY583_02610, partial [Candidatus Omnitrophica bacterium]|nr:hypothetical protein [Candidatus Omnitrophota bacterium]